jgi:hypothetical protein
VERNALDESTGHLNIAAMTKNQKRPAVVVSTTRDKRGGEITTIRDETGRFETVVTKPSSVAAMDRTVKKYSRALSNLAKR